MFVHLKTTAIICFFKVLKEVLLVLQNHSFDANFEGFESVFVEIIFGG